MKGYRFECRVRNALKKRGYMVIRQYASAFPDLIALPNQLPHINPMRFIPDENGALVSPLIIECKWNKYISRSERVRFREWEGHGYLFIAYPKTNSQDRRKTDIVLCDLNYKEVMRL